MSTSRDPDRRLRRTDEVSASPSSERQPRLTPPPRGVPAADRESVARGGAGAPLRRNRSPDESRRIGAGGFVLLGGLAVVAVAVLFLLPRWVERDRPSGPADEAGPAASAAVLPEAVEGAAVAVPSSDREREGQLQSTSEVPGRAAASSPDAAGVADDHVGRAPVDGRAAEIDDRIARGEEALSRGDLYAASTAFSRVLELAPGHPIATRGLEIARAREQGARWLAAGTEAERAGRGEEARALYRQAATVDASAAAARAGLSRLGDASRSELLEVVDEGLDAVAAGELDRAASVLERASALGPETPEVADLGQRVERLRHRQRLADLSARAEIAAGDERWQEALELWRRLLELDPALAAARVGERQAGSRLDLDRRLEGHLAHPERLSGDEVLEDARRALEGALEVSEPGPRLRSQIARLDELVGAMATPVRVTLLSDRETEVTVYRVGRLGAFERRELELRPGRYTVVGERPGYRDVRLTLVVENDRPRSLAVRCEEPI